MKIEQNRTYRKQHDLDAHTIAEDQLPVGWSSELDTIIEGCTCISLESKSYLKILGAKSMKHKKTGSITQKSVAMATEVCEPLALLNVFVH
jgi:hypothetical protein